MSVAAPRKLAVRKDKRSIEVTFGDEVVYEFPAEMLRVLSPSAEVQGHSRDQRITIAAKQDVTIIKMEPIGNYAVRITFDDMHDTGIYSWNFFRELGENMDARWQGYLDDLAKSGKKRTP